MVSQDGVNYMTYRDGQGGVGDVPCPDPHSACAHAVAGRLPGRHADSAVTTSAACTTSAWRGKMRPVRKSWTSGSESEQQSSTTIRL